MTSVATMAKELRDNPCMATLKLQITGEEEADKLLSTNPLALLLGMVLDQQVTMEWAFRGPLELSQRMGGDLRASTIAAMDPERLATLFSERPALHRYPGSMAARCQAVCAVVSEEYSDDPATIWSQAADSADLYHRIKSLPGFGEMKAKIFIALLGKQVGLPIKDWEAVCAPYGERGVYRSVADIVDQKSLEKVRAAKQAAKRKAKQGKA